jgi:hypothetical protein
MHWFRSRTSLGVALALFALAIQLVASFGHVHLDRHAPLTAPSVALFQVAADAGASGAPTGDEAPSTGHHHCAICALIHLAGTALAAEPPALPLPIAFGSSPPTPGSEVRSAAPDRGPFAARAPPIA